MAAKRQDGTGNSLSANNVTLTWNSFTTAPHDLLVAVIGHSADPGIYNAASGWNRIYSVSKSGIGQATYISFWASNDTVGSESSTNFSWANTTGVNAVYGIEESGVSSATVDTNNTNNGTGATLTTGSTGVLAQANEIVYGAFGNAVSGISDPVFSAPTNSFTIEGNTTVNDGGAIHLVVSLSDLIVAATTSVSTGVTTSTSGNWCAGIASFKLSSAVNSLITPIKQIQRERSLHPSLTE